MHCVAALSTSLLRVKLAPSSLVRLVANPPSVAPHSHAWLSALKEEQLRTCLLLQPDPDNLKREIEAFRVAAAGTGGDAALRACVGLVSSACMCWAG